MNYLQLAKEQASEFIALRHAIHAEPELSFNEHKTAALVAARLKEYGYEVHENIASTGIIALLKKGSGEKTIAFRADMDALPMSEESGCTYASKIANKMHACGHDGHTATLLLAAKLLSQMQFNGTVMLVFQPSEEACDEEGLTGAMKMVASGAFDKFKADWIFGYHNMPSMQMKNHPATVFAKPGAFMAGAARYTLTFKGRGGHASAPQLCADPIAVAASFISSLYSFKSNYLSALSGAVLNVTAINASAGAFNIIPNTATLGINMRSLIKEQMLYMQERLEAIAKAAASGFGIDYELIRHENLMPTTNDAKASEFLCSCAREIFGDDAISDDHEAIMGSEDFGYLVDAIGCGCYCFINNGDSANLHAKDYVFNDELISKGAALWVYMACEYLK